jgi:hypothetical protein
MNEATAGLDPRFMEFVLSHQNFALMTLGRIPHPETGTTETNLDAARMFIDQLEMIEGKTRGNLSAPESRLLGGVLTQLRLAYVEAMKANSATSMPGNTTETQQADKDAGQR